MSIKLSADQKAGVLYEAQAALLKVAAERDELAQKVASYQKREEAEKLATAMREKGLEVTEKMVAELEKAAVDKREVLHAALNLVAPDMGTKIAQYIASDETSSVVPSSAAEARLIAAICG